jgi:hypothetical protein
MPDLCLRRQGCWEVCHYVLFVGTRPGDKGRGVFVTLLREMV